MALDSMGLALSGDAEAARDVVAFFNEVLELFRAAGVTVLIIDHQSRLQAGENYQHKGAFGSVYKEHLARSRIQVEATDRRANELTVRLRQKKHNFGGLADPFGCRITFAEEAITLTPVELGDDELADEGTLNAGDRLRHGLTDGPAYPAELAEATGLNLKTVKNWLKRLRDSGDVEYTGEVDGQARQVSLVSPPLGDKDTGDTFEQGKEQLVQKLIAEGFSEQMARAEVEGEGAAI